MIRFLPAAFFAWCHDSAISEWINDSTWAFAIIETFHILALTVLLGTIVALDLRLLHFSDIGLEPADSDLVVWHRCQGRRSCS